jgi:PAS domain S-box-containing protein
MTSILLPMPGGLSIRHKVVLGFGVVLIIFAVVAVMMWRSTHGFLSTAELAARSREILETGERALRRLTEMESERRGFLISGDDSHLANSARAEAAVTEDINVLERLSEDAPTQQARIAAIKQLILRSIALQHEEIETRRTQGSEAAARLFASAGGNEVSAEVRGLMTQLADEERRLLEDRNERTKRIGAWTSGGILLAGALTLIVLFAAGTMILRDIGARRRAEEALADQHNLLSSIIDTMPDHLSVKDVKGRYIMDNKAHRTYLRLPNGESIEGKTVFDFFPRDLAARYDDDDQKVIETGVPVRNREEPGLPSAGTEAWFLTTKVPLIEAGGRILGLVCVSADITERKDAEERLKRFAMQLEQSNAELQNFASVASHDLQEPLRKIQAFGDRLRAKCLEQLGENGRDYLERMQNAASRMQILIQDLLKLSRITSRAQAFVPCDLQQLVRDVLTDLEVAMEEAGAHVEVGALPIVEGDPVQLRQLFQNLIANALKFHKPDTPPEVTISAEVATPGERVIPGAGPGEEICQIEVRDNGIGFDPQFVERIFVVFQRLHSRTEFEGTGIGLAICRKITDRHGGTIVAKSTAGEGATFVVTLPVRQLLTDADERQSHADHDSDGR